ncbi:MAG: RES family NAD+ phosphorylase [Bdellovibrionales bacterium]|nr:RES family NAD+ phosphorylase [Bdellovibrionales bacterium]
MGKGKGKGRKWFDSFKTKKNALIKNGFRSIAPSSFVESEIIRISTLNDNQREFWKNLQQHLIEEREKIISDIIGAIDSTKKEGFESEYCRIVSSEFSNDPLNGAGSVLRPPGGRFNLAKTSSLSNYFIGLYMAEDYETAFAEKFHQSNEDQTENLLCDFSLRPIESFSYYRTSIKIQNYIDLTTDETLKAFIVAIKDIEAPEYYLSMGKSLNIPVTMATNEILLRKSFFNAEYPLWAAWLDQPAPSQLFGHYCREAGIEGILYPSVRNPSKKNMVLFPDNFKDSSAVIELLDKAPHVPAERRKITKENYQNFINL